MTKTLIVMRHAKSGWDTPLPDIERPLNTRGHKSAKALGDWLRAKSLIPGEILCSAATRTQQTVEGLALETQPTLIRALYHSSAETLLDHARKAQAGTVLIVAHNPGVADFAERLSTTSPAHPRFWDYPTGATTVFDCPIDDWSELQFGANTATHFTIPREL